MGVHPAAPVAEPPSTTVPDGPVERMNLRTRTEAKATWCPHARSIVGGSSFNRLAPDMDGNTNLSPAHACCIADQCSQWRWREAGGTRYEQRSFQSDYPVPAGGEGPIEVPDGWAFDHWDAAAKGRPLPRYWARRAVEIVLPKGCCGLAGPE